jgi:hypothetical protein
MLMNRGFHKYRTFVPKIIFQCMIQGILVAGLLMAFQNSLIAKGPPKDPPLTVTIKALSDASEQYDGRRVIVTGRVRSMEIQEGRRGSSYVMMVLEAVDAQPGRSVPTVNVIILNIPKVGMGNDALVQGTYHREGKQAGKTFEHFIDAEVVLKEKL